MLPSEPVWRVKSRPCPFYQQGKCFFQENCNFMHDVQARTRSNVINEGSPVGRKDTPHGPTVHIHSPPHSVRSPRRSPRMSGLLLALKDVIGEVDDEEDEYTEEATLEDPGHDTSSASLTLVHSPPAKVTELAVVQERNHPLSPPEPVAEYASHRITPDLLSPVGSEVSNLPSVPFPLRISSRSSRRDDSIDSGYADSWHSPRPLVLSPPRSPALSSTFDILVSPFGTPSARVRRSTPVPVSPLALSFDERSNSPPLGPNSDDVESDLGHGSPARLIVEPKSDNEDEAETRDLFDFPSGDMDTLRRLSQPLSEDMAQPSSPYLDSLSVAERSWDLSERDPTAIFSPQVTVDPGSIAQDVRHSLDAENPIDWLTAGSTSFNGGDVALISSPLLTTATKPISSPMESYSPMPLTPDLLPPTSASYSEESSASECVTEEMLEDDTSIFSAFSPTARLAYVTSPDSAAHIPGSDDDTLYSLYDTYTSESPKQSPPPSIHSPTTQERSELADSNPVSLIDSPASTISRKSRNTDKTPTKSTFELQRERVFTPPPIPSSSTSRERSSTVTHTSSHGSPVWSTLPSPTPSLPEPTFASPLSPVPPPSRNPSLSPTCVAGVSGEILLEQTQPFPKGRMSPEFSRNPASFAAQSPFLTHPYSPKLVEALRDPLEGEHIHEPSSDGDEPDPLKVCTGDDSVSSDHYSGSSHPNESSSPPIEAPSSTAGQTRRSFLLKPLRLSTISNLSSSASRLPYITSTSVISPASTYMHPLASAPSIFGSSKRSSIASASVTSMSRNSMVSSKRSSCIPSYIANTITSHHDESDDTVSTMNYHRRSSNHDSMSRRQSTISYRRTDTWTRASLVPTFHTRSSSNFSEPTGLYDVDEDPTITEGGGHIVASSNDDDDDERIYQLPTPNTAPPSRAPSVMDSPHAVATPSPHLIFAIASDDVDQVRRVLSHGGANPNERLGPQSALAFTITNDALENKLALVKTLLAHGADPKGLEEEVVRQNNRRGSKDSSHVSDSQITTEVINGGMEHLDPATKYYLKRAGAVHTRQTSALIFRSFFRPLTKVRYEMVGQDRALEQLFKVLSIHSKQLSVAPIVVLLCGPSGHGKSLLARRFGSLLDVPTHTVNMTTVRSTLDLWRSYSLSPYEEPSTSTLAEFLVENEGKRCVVVLDEIEKTEDPKALHSLLMPWELGRCSFEAGSRHVDVRNVIWLGTSNVGQDLVFEHDAAREQPDALMLREEYVQLMALLRPRVSDQLGTSILSRVTTVLPFVSFTTDEKMAIASEAFHTLAGDLLKSISNDSLTSMIEVALDRYLPSEGARSLYRAVSELLLDAI